MRHLTLVLVGTGFALGLAAQSVSASPAGTGLTETRADSDAMFYSRAPAGNGKAPAPFTAAVARRLAEGVEVTATGINYPVKLLPVTLSRGEGVRNNEVVTYQVAPGVRVVQSFKKNGVKEDIIYDDPAAAPSELTFRMVLDPMTEARLDGIGNVLIYGPSAVLAGFIQTGDEKSAALVLNARRHAAKDHLLYVIPAPVIVDGAGRSHSDLARYELEDGSKLIIHTEKLSLLPGPVSIDPSVVVTTTADFGTGNNEGMISFDTDAISRAAPSGGSIGAWSATTSFTTPRYSHTSVAYNGYLYVIGGNTLNDVQVAPINADGTIGVWSATTSFTQARYGHTSVAYNGYLYVIGGTASVSYFSDVQVAPINANGTVGAWSATTSLTTSRYGHTSVAYNGYLYVVGGYGGSGSFLNDVQVAPINANGTIGVWSATTSFPTARYHHASVAYNGHLYVIGGTDGGTYLGDVQVAQFNTNGTIGAWTATTSFPTPRYGHTSVAYNGILYVIGGTNGSSLNNVQAAPINAGGTIGAWSATTSFPTPRRYHTSVAYNGTLYVIGGDSGAYRNDVQVAPFTAGGTIGAWSATTSFSTTRYAHTSVAYNGYLYVIGGTNGFPLSDVQVAPINANGTLGAWSATSSLGTSRYGHTSVAYNGYLYVIGGFQGQTLNDVQVAPINANGTLGAWSATTSFPTPRYFHTSVAYYGYLYVIGGTDVYGGGSELGDVQVAPINANGTIGAWSATTSFPSPRERHTSVAYNGNLYVIGGLNGSYLNDVQVAPINANGTIGAWSATTSFSTPRMSPTSVACNGTLYVMGGYGGSWLNDVQVATINADGTIGAWSAPTSFPTPRTYHASVAYNGFLYVIGGSSSGSYLNDVQVAHIGAGSTIGAWSATTSFLTPRRDHASVAYNGFLYVIGGYNGSYFNDVQVAPINANGTVGAWVATTSFPTARDRFTSVAYNGYLYVIGGHISSGGYLSDIQVAPINAGGTIGAWSATTSFPNPRYGHTSVAYNGYLYVIGGNSALLRNDVQVAPINANGTIGAWTATTSFPTPRYAHTSVVYNGFLYVIGGGGTSYFNDVQVAPINVNGTLGAWTATTSFPTPRQAHASTAFNGYLYVIGGYSGSYLNDIQVAPINAGGTIGPWINTSFPTPRFSHASVAYNGTLYVIGGYSGADLNDVLATTLNGSAARARYSQRLDLGADTQVNSLSFSGAGNGVVNLSYAVASAATSVFGARTTIPNAAAGTPYTAGLGACSRYVWASFDLDDTQSATIDGGGLNGRKALSDFTINITTPASPGNSLLGGKSATLNLNWTVSAGATKYNVKRCTGACLPVTIVATPATNSYSEAMNATSYFYAVEAVGACAVTP